MVERLVVLLPKPRECAMASRITNPKSKDMRRMAAEALRDARRKERPQTERDVDRKVANAYKGLADNEEWLSASRSGQK